MLSLMMIGVACQSQVKKAEATGLVHKDMTAFNMCLQAAYVGGPLAKGDRGGPCSDGGKVAECEDSIGNKYVFYKGASQASIRTECGPDVVIGG